MKKEQETTTIRVRVRARQNTNPTNGYTQEWVDNRPPEVVIRELREINAQLGWEKYRWEDAPTK